MTPEDVLAEVLLDAPFYGNDGGVTFSGGECMLQKDFLLTCLRLCKEKGIHTAVDTAGHVCWEAFLAVMPYTDLFLYDIKAMDDAVHQHYTGCSNALILENLGKLLDSGANVWGRIPVIPGVNDTPENFQALKAFLSRHKAPEKIELLPYHAMGETKYTALGRPHQCFSVPTKAYLAQLEKYIL
jgi:pyruvate formate lyase activating enzyme